MSNKNGKQVHYFLYTNIKYYQGKIKWLLSASTNNNLYFINIIINNIFSNITSISLCLDDQSFKIKYFL